jgi:hypothetical protein
VRKTNDHRTHFEPSPGVRRRIGEWTYITLASGGASAEFSHEFQAITDAGEHISYLHKGKESPSTKK